MNYELRIKEALDNAADNIAYFSRLADAKLEKKLRNVHEQMSLAEANRQDGALRLLRIWEEQIIEARIIKHEQTPELDELSDIEIELAKLEAMEKEAEKRNRVLNVKRDIGQVNMTDDEGQVNGTRNEGPEDVTDDEGQVKVEEKKPDQLKLF